MPIQVECGSCGQELRVKDELAGRRVRCPKCKEAIALPEADAPILEADSDPEIEAEPEQELPMPKRQRRPQRDARRLKSLSKSQNPWYVTYWQWLVGAAVLISAPFTLFFAGLSALGGLLLMLIGGVVPCLRILADDPATVLAMVMSRSARIGMMFQPDNHPYKVLCRKAFGSTRGFFFRGLVLLVMAAASFAVHRAQRASGQADIGAANGGFRIAEPIVEAPAKVSSAPLGPTRTGDPNQIFYMKMSGRGFQGAGAAGSTVRTILAEYPSVVPESIEVDDAASTVRFQFRGKIDEGKLLKQLQQAGISNLTLSSALIPPP